MMINSPAKFLANKIVRDKFIAPSVQENTPKKIVKINRTASLRVSQISERISLGPPTLSK